ncbi:MAG: beta-eliminating lyase-related protein [Pirellulaceae bacterium]
MLFCPSTMFNGFVVGRARTVWLRTPDGARLFNAVVATECLPRHGQEFDTVSVCLSKGLGAPIGSILAGPKSIQTAMRRHRKLFGGAMRQNGILAAAAIYALENNIERLARDHESALDSGADHRETM